jgi:hypothetical protein
MPFERLAAEVSRSTGAHGTNNWLIVGLGLLNQ